MPDSRFWKMPRGILPLCGGWLAVAACSLQGADLPMATLSSQLYDSVFQNLVQDAEKGNPELAVTMGIMCQEGRGMEQSAEKAVEWFRKGAEGGDPFGMINLGIMYVAGDGTEKDFVKGYAWIRLSAQRFKPGKYKDGAVERAEGIRGLMSREEISEAEGLLNELERRVPRYAGNY